MSRGGQVLIATAEVDVDETYAALHVPMKPGPYVALTVTDTGHGMDASTLARVFEPFFTTKETGRGTGLGLATVYGIVKQMGGFVWVSSKPGQGTTFTVHFPVTSEQPSVKPSATSHTTVSHIGKETILVVEDEPGVRSLVTRVLQRHGYNILVAGSPAEALELVATARQLDLVLTDVVMPEMWGPELIRRLQLPATTKVRYMSGYDADPQRPEHAIGPGAALLEKPFTAAELLRHVREALETTRS
jgi:two-component system cell cycle sensor histidine kinase/response regulator CckA